MRHGIAPLFCALVLLAGCGPKAAPATTDPASPTTATVVASAFLFSTPAASPATIVPPTATGVAPTPVVVLVISTAVSPTQTEVSASSTPSPAAIVTTPDATITPQPTTRPATATRTVVSTRPRPSATRVPIAPTATPAGVTFITVKGANPGQTASVTVQTAPGATCSIAYSTSHGTDSVPAGLVPKKADGQGRITWAWLIGARTVPGTASVIVTCGGASASASFVIG